MEHIAEKEKRLHRIKDLICIIKFTVENMKDEGRIFPEEEKNILESCEEILKKC